MLDLETKNVFFQNLDEYILDEEKIVTARWLAKTLNITYQDSACVLAEWTENKQANENILTTFAVSGKKKDGSLIVTILRDFAVEEFVQNLSEVSKSVYSAQKSVLKDIQLLAAANESYSSCLGSIKGPVCKKRDAPSLIHEVPTEKTDFNAPKVEQANGNTLSTSTKTENEKISSTQSSTKPTKVKEVAKGGIANFFNKQGSTKNVDNQTKKNEIKMSNKSKSMQDFFKKSSPLTKPVKVEEESPLEESSEKLSEIINDESSKDVNEKSSKKVNEELKNSSHKNACFLQEKKSEKPIKKEIDLSDDDIIPGTPEVISKPISKKNKNKTKPKRVREGSDEGNSKKKRKRIIVQSDSSDDDIFGKESDKDEEMEVCDAESPPTKQEEETPLKKSSEQNGPKNKQKKYVNKTYTDEDGFILTKRELVECSSGDEEVNEVKEKPMSPSKPLPKKITLNPGTKQSNLMSFFKKK